MFGRGTHSRVDIRSGAEGSPPVTRCVPTDTRTAMGRGEGTRRRATVAAVVLVGVLIAGPVPVDGGYTLTYNNGTMFRTAWVAS